MAQRFVPPMDIIQSLGLTEKQFKRAVRVNYVKTIEAWWQMYAAQGRALVYQVQHQLAMGDATHRPNSRMLVWLGKQHMGQREQIDIIQKALPGGTETEIPAGYQIMVPGGSVVVDAQKELPKPRDELPIVEALIIEESNPKEERQPSAGQKRVISGHAEGV